MCVRLLTARCVCAVWRNGAAPGERACVHVCVCVCVCVLAAPMSGREMEREVAAYSQNHDELTQTHEHL